MGLSGKDIALPSTPRHEASWRGPFSPSGEGKKLAAARWFREPWFSGDSCRPGCGHWRWQTVQHHECFPVVGWSLRRPHLTLNLDTWMSARVPSPDAHPVTASPVGPASRSSPRSFLSPVPRLPHGPGPSSRASSCVAAALCPLCSPDCPVRSPLASCGYLNSDWFE